MSSKIKMFLRTITLAASMFTSGYFARISESNKIMLAPFVFAFFTSTYLAVMLIFDN